MKIIPVYLRYEGIDPHGAGCDCDFCDHKGRSRGFSVRSIFDPEGDPFSVYYGASEDAANDAAREVCKLNGWQFVNFDLDTKEVNGVIDVALEELFSITKEDFLSFIGRKLVGRVLADVTYVLEDVGHLGPNMIGIAVTGTLMPAEENQQEHQPEEQITCSECDSTANVVSTFCGSFCPDHLNEHVDHCAVCAPGFIF